MRALADLDFAALRDYLRATAGLEFDESRRPSLAAVISDRLPRSGQPDVPAYLRFLDRPDGVAERQHLLDDVTIQETHFHRARPQIDALRQHLLPGLLQTASAEGRGITVWSAGCSTGEEPYTLAMIALEVRESLGLSAAATPAIRVVGTDVSAAALDVARRAEYSGRTVDLGEPGAVARWLSPAGSGRYVVRDEVRALVEFAHHNLVTEPPPFPEETVDLVVCRNVTIYFSRETTRGLITRFRSTVAPTGWLLLGAAETLWQISDAFSLVGVGEAFAYRPMVAPVHALPTRVPSANPARQRRPKTASVPAQSVSSPRLRASNRGVAAATTLARREVLGSRRPAPELLDQARAALEETRYGDAAELAAEAVRADPLLTEAYVVCGQAHATLGHDADALGPLGRAVYLDSRAGHAWFLLAGSLGRTGDRAGAARAYRAAASALPTAPAEAVRGLLDGAPVEQLVQLCRRLADDLEGRDNIRRGA